MVREKVRSPPSYVSQQPSPEPQLGSTVSYPPPASVAATTVTPYPPPPQYQAQPEYPPAQQSPLPQVDPSTVQISAQYQHQLFARCAQGNHDLTTKYGACGVITAICLFPFGLICLFMDREVRCARCGVTTRR